MSATYVIISTHTTRHLEATLAGVAMQQPRPGGVVVSIDNDRSEVLELCRTCSGRFDLPIVVVWRPSPGEVRVGQVRNNGVRALLAGPPELRPDRADWLHFLDGDSVAPTGMLAEAERVRSGHDLLVGGRVMLDEEQTQRFDVGKFLRGEPPGNPTEAQRADVAARHGRYVWQSRFKRLGLVKMHKPKVLGANHACTLSIYERVDGYDESFLGAWREDDDFGRRVYLAGGRGCVAVQNVCVFHLWHPLNPQKRENWSELPTEGKTGDPWMPRQGMTSPRQQAGLNCELVVQGKIERAWTVAIPSELVAS